MDKRYLRKAGGDIFSQLHFEVKNLSDYFPVNYFQGRAGRYYSAFF